MSPLGPTEKIMKHIEIENIIEVGNTTLKTTKRKSAWGNVIMLVCGTYLTFLSFEIWYEPTKIKSFEPPKIEELTVSSGEITFYTPWRGSGGTSYIHLENGKTLNLRCGGPFYTNNCYYIKENNQWVNKELELSRKRVKVWWFPTKKHSDSGTIYQLEANGKMYFSYKDKKEEYMLEFIRGSSESPFIFILFFLMLVLLPAIRLLREVTK